MDPWIGEEPEIVRLSPIDALVLTQQRDHWSTDIWNDEVKYLVLTVTLIFMFSLTFSKFFQSRKSSTNNCLIFIDFAGPGAT